MKKTQTNLDSKANEKHEKPNKNSRNRCLANHQQVGDSGLLLAPTWGGGEWGLSVDSVPKKQHTSPRNTAPRAGGLSIPSPGPRSLYPTTVVITVVGGGCVTSPGMYDCSLLVAVG